MIQTAMVSAGIDFDVSALSVLPEAVTNDKIVVITDMLPPLADGVVFDIEEPAEPAAGLIYINSGKGVRAITQQGNVTLIIRPGDAIQWDGAEWRPRYAYLGVNGEWERISFPRPWYTYSGLYEEYVDGDYIYIKLFSSGARDFKSSVLLDVFLVGGGGGGGYHGGGGGYTTNAFNVAFTGGSTYVVAVGAGGAGCQNVGYVQGTNGGVSSISLLGTTMCSANGGQIGNGGGTDPAGMSKGGSGGGTGGSSAGGAGGVDGGNGGSAGGYPGGAGQGTTTRAFAVAGGELYSTGGKGGTYSMAANGVSAAANTGNGGGGSWTSYKGGNGGSGIIILRYKIEEVAA